LKELVLGGFKELGLMVLRSWFEEALRSWF
jgi:hypothetical protein